MKRLHAFLLSCVLLSAVVALPLVSAGCKSPSVQKQAVNTLFSVGSAVDTTYKAYLDLVIGGQLATNNLPRVSKDYGTFQRVFAVGVELVAGNTNATAPQIVLDAAAAFNHTVVAAKKGAL